MSLISSLRQSKLLQQASGKCSFGPRVEHRRSPVLLPLEDCLENTRSPTFQPTSSPAESQAFKRHHSTHTLEEVIIARRKSKPTKPHKFKLSLQYPPSVRDDANAKITIPYIPQYVGFTLHSLWSQDESGWAYGKNLNAPPLNLQRVPKISDSLKKFWPNLENSNDQTANERFWQHEWKKHGWHSGFLAEQYFEIALLLRKSLSAGQQTDIYSVANCVRQELGKMKIGQWLRGAYVDPEINCSMDKQNTRHVKEVGVCFDNLLISPEPCQRTFSGTCSGLSDKVILPPYK